MPRLSIIVGALLAAAAVALGAYHAHGLEKLLSQANDLQPVELAKKMHDFEVAVRYQAMHAIGLVLVGLIGIHAVSRWLAVAVALFVIGTALFSGCLILTVLTGIRVPWFLVPAGGLSLILGWIAVAIGSLYTPTRRPSEGFGAGKQH